MAELKNVALEKRLDVLDSTLADKRGELKEVRGASGFRL